MLGSTDLPTLLITAVVFLAGFSSLRLHATFASKRKTLDEIVSSVTTVPGFGDQLRVIDQEISLAANIGDDWKVRAAELRGVRDPALTDRDLASARPLFEPAKRWHTWWVVDRIATMTFGVVAVILVCLVCLIWYDFASGNHIGAGIVALAIGCVVIAITWSDMNNVVTEYVEISRALELRCPTATLWSAAAPEAPLSHRSSLDRLHNADAPTGLKRAVLSKTTDMYPEWGTPRALMAYTLHDETKFSARASEQSLAQRETAAEALYHALRAVEVNPLDPGSRIILAALTIDTLVMDCRSLVKAGTLEKLHEPLPFSDVTSKDDERDWSRPQRWRFSQALRRAREASLLVERRWGSIAGNRSAAGRLTDLDRIAVDYQLGRAYVLSACESPGPTSRENSASARKLLQKAKNGEQEIKSLLPHLTLFRGATIDAGTQGQPQALCWDEDLDWWQGIAATVDTQPRTGTFANPWPNPDANAASTPEANASVGSRS